jgi:hypothetical protein
MGARRPGRNLRREAFFMISDLPSVNNVTQSEVAAGVEEVELGDEEGGGNDGDGEQGDEPGGKELEGVHEAAGEEAEKTAAGKKRINPPARAGKQVLEGVVSEAEVIVGMLVKLPFGGSDEEEAGAGTGGASEFEEGGSGVGDVLEGDDAEKGVEGGVAERKTEEVAEGVEGGVIPGSVADGEIETDVLLAREEFFVLAFAGASIEKAGLGG